MSTLCVATAAAVLSWATSSFTLSWTHSVEKTEWQESWSIEDDALILKEARVKGSGAGMDPGEGAQLIDGWWVWQPALATANRVAPVGLWCHGFSLDPVR